LKWDLFCSELGAETKTGGEKELILRIKRGQKNPFSSSFFFLFSFSWARFLFSQKCSNFSIVVPLLDDGSIAGRKRTRKERNEPPFWGIFFSIFDLLFLVI